jgi:HAD superfamily hydrolase (TIGR01450 family)
VTDAARPRGAVFDLDGCIWNGGTLNRGAGELIADLARHRIGVAFLTNNSRATAAGIQTRLAALGIDADAERVLTPLEIIGTVIRERHGVSRVLVIGAPEMARVIGTAGHEVLAVPRYREATVVAVGADFDLTYERLTVAARAVAAGAAFVTPNLDTRLPIEDGDFLPGCGAIVEAVAAAARRRPEVIGKPEAPLFHLALRRLGLEPAQAVMVGDSEDADVAGALRVGMRAILYAPGGAASTRGEAVVRSFAALRDLLLGALPR